MPQKSHSLFVKVLVVLFALSMLAALLIPNFLRARRASSSKSIRLIENSREIDALIQQYSIEHNQKTGPEIKEVDWAALRGTLKKGENNELPTAPSLGLDAGTRAAPTTSLDLPNQKIQPPSTFMPSSKSMPLIPPNSVPLHILSDPKIEKPDYEATAEKKP